MIDYLAIYLDYLLIVNLVEILFRYDIIKKIGELAYKLDWDGINKLVSDRLGK